MAKQGKFLQVALYVTFFFLDTDDISSIGDVTSPANTTLDGVPVVKSSQGIVYIGFINDWIRTYNYIKGMLIIKSCTL